MSDLIDNVMFVGNNMFGNMLCEITSGAQNTYWEKDKKESTGNHKLLRKNLYLDEKHDSNIIICGNVLSDSFTFVINDRFNMNYINEFTLILNGIDDINKIKKIRLAIGGQAINTVSKEVITLLNNMDSLVYIKNGKCYFDINFLTFDYSQPLPLYLLEHHKLEIIVDVIEDEIRYMEMMISFTSNKNVKIPFNNSFIECPDYDSHILNKLVDNIVSLNPIANIFKKAIDVDFCSEIPCLQYQTKVKNIGINDDHRVKLEFNHVCFGLFIYFLKDKNDTTSIVDVIHSMVLHCNIWKYKYSKLFLLDESYRIANISKKSKAPIYFLPISGLNPFIIENSYEGDKLNFSRLDSQIISFDIIPGILNKNSTVNIIGLSGNVARFMQGMAGTAYSA